MTMTRWARQRRDFLKALGAGAGLIPLLGETRAQAQTRGRLITMVKPNGCRADAFWPTWSGGRPPDGNLAGATLPAITRPLDPFRRDITFLDGLALRNWLKSEGNTTGDSGDAHHDWPSLLTGMLPSDRLLTVGGCRPNTSPPGCRMLAGGPSIDCFIGQELQRRDPTLRYASLNVGLRGGRAGHGFDTASWTGRDKPNIHENNPYRVFDAVFAGVRPAGAAPDLNAERNVRLRLRLLDYVGKDVQRFGRRLGGEDRAMLDSHLDSVATRGKQLTALLGATGPACNVPALPAAVGTAEPNVGKVSTMMLDMLVDAMKCGLTRVGFFTMFDSNSYDILFSWLKDVNSSFANGRGVGGYPVPHMHGMAHGGYSEPGGQMYIDANRWMVEQLAYLLKRLKSEPEGTGTMLDSTVVLYADTLAHGNFHTIARLPWILAGNVNRYFAQGRHVQLGSSVAPNRLLVSLATALGVPPQGGVFGDRKFGTGELAALKA